MITLPKVCPRCAGDTTNQYGALSRTDNKTMVCSNCGKQEALEQFGFGSPLPQSLWRTSQTFDISKMESPQV